VAVLADPRLLLPDAPEVAAALAESGWSSAALHELLGPHFPDQVERGELAPLRRRTTGASLLTRLARALVLGEPVVRGTLPETWVGPDGTARVRLQVLSHGGLDVTVAHDPAARTGGIETAQVLGAGAASLTLAAATPRAPVGRALDLGCGSGIQALLAASHSGQVTVTDRNPRATALTQLAAVLNGRALDGRTGDLLQPVQGEVFDLVVSNPPFVISPAARYTYRDAGYRGDDLCRTLIQQLPSVLAPGGHAVLLANWLHVAGEDGDDRIRSWFEGTGCDAWVVQRELAAPEEYVTAWLRDTDEAAFDDRYDDWLDSFDGVDAVAFGIVAMHRPADGHVTGVVLEQVDHPTSATWGEEVVAHFARRRLLEGDLLAVPLALRPDVRLDQVASRGAAGWEIGARTLRQETGLRRWGGIDPYGATLLAACDGRTPLGDLIALLAGTAGLDVTDATEQVLPVVRALVEQGFLTVGP
jgi:SAM-dependent methyltransferase